MKRTIVDLLRQAALRFTSREQREWVKKNIRKAKRIFFDESSEHHKTVESFRRQMVHASEENKKGILARASQTLDDRENHGVLKP